MSIQTSISSSGSITRMTLLAFLWFRPMHGYEVRKEIEDRWMDRWADVQYGSIYASLRQLTREGLLEEVGTEREGKRPPRTVYRIMESGKEELFRLLRQALVRPVFSARPVDVGLSFFMLLPFDEIVRLLEERLASLAALAEELDAGEEQKDRAIKEQGIPLEPGIEAMVSDIFDHSRRLFAAEKEWTEHVLNRVRSGAYEIDEETMKTWRKPDARD